MDQTATDFRRSSPASSSVSLQSDRSMDPPLEFSKPSTIHTQSNSKCFTRQEKMHQNYNTKLLKYINNQHKMRSSPASSSVSLQSDRSMDPPLEFSKPRRSSPASSSVSLQSDRSMDPPLEFSKPRASSPASSSVSLKSDCSRMEPPMFSGDRSSEITTSSSVSKSLEADPSKSDDSSLSEEEERHEDEMGFPKSSQDSDKNLKILQTKILEKYQNDVKEKLNTEIYEMKAKTVVKKIDALFKDGRTVLTTGVAGVGKTFQGKKYVVKWAKQKVKKRHLKIFLDFEQINLKSPQSITDLLNDCFEDVNPSLDYSSYNMTIILDGLDKCDLPLDFENNRKLTDITETAPVNELLTNLIQGNLLPSAQLWILTRPSGQDKIPEQYIHTVTECRGESVQSQREHDLPLPFRELNLRKDDQLSLEDLLYDFFPCMKTSEITDYNKYKVLIVLDGLDECRLELDLSQQQKWSDIKQKMPVNDLLSNLIIGNLLPEAQVWITSRPTALRCIPADKVERVTEVRGFNDEQKEEYFRKQFDLDLAEKVLCYVKESRCIFLMCHIPVFCWIAAKVLEAFVQNGHQGIPKTLTDLFVHFLLLQCKQANAKYNQTTDEDSTTWNERNVNCVLGLSQMAFEGLEKGDLLFTEDDLISYGLDVEEASVYSGLLTRVRREESELYPEQFFSFVHLSIQEFLAAFYVFYTFSNEGENVFSTSDSSEQSVSDWSEESASDWSDRSEESASDFYKSAVDKALKSKNGDWDLFLRFLLGLSLKTNHDLLKEVLKTPENTEQINKEIIDYIKTKIDGEHSEEGCDADTSMNLFHCLNELNDRSLVEEIKKYLQADKKNYENFSRAKWAALTFVLLTSDQNLDVFDLKKYCKSETVLLGMVPVVNVAKKALLSWCELSERSCGALSSSILTSASSNLTELDLSHNELMDSGVEKLSDGLKNLTCKLNILRLAGCRISEKGCAFLISALKGNKSSVLEKLDLSYNHPGPEEEKLKALESDPDVKLKEVWATRWRSDTADLTFDVNHKHPRIIVENQTAQIWKNVPVTKILKANSERHVVEKSPRRQVFCEQELSGLCYWELEWEGTVGVGVCYKGAASKCVLGWDDMSWAVFTSNQSSSCLEFNAPTQASSPQKPTGRH
ncbi:hypothetical protein WMY93_027116 [Mugilogobius chulae]|uniref:NACHT domain-containing protein n=1 Tax=Mugilogobius chulae TaxID=88201 RepID=A0AAW0MWP7_9GOBI